VRSKIPFLLDRCVAWLPQIGQWEDFFKMDMAASRASGWGPILYTQLLILVSGLQPLLKSSSLVPRGLTAEWRK